MKLYLPGAQSVQELAPLPLKDPGLQGEHEDCPAPANLPAAQRVWMPPSQEFPAPQGAQELAPALLKAPGLHGKHSLSEVLPVFALDLPAAQLVQDGAEPVE
jgi:hypothetical protein